MIQSAPWSYIGIVKSPTLIQRWASHRVGSNAEICDQTLLCDIAFRLGQFVFVLALCTSEAGEALEKRLIAKFQTSFPMGLNVD
jgi:hypothetical protein